MSVIVAVAQVARLTETTAATALRTEDYYTESDRLKNDRIFCAIIIKKIAAGTASNFSYQLLLLLYYHYIPNQGLVRGVRRRRTDQNVYLRQVRVHCTVVRQRVIRRKSQHPDMWAVLMTRLHRSLLAFRSKAITTSILCEK